MSSDGWGKRIKLSVSVTNLFLCCNVDVSTWIHQSCKWQEKESSLGDPMEEALALCSGSSQQTGESQ